MNIIITGNGFDLAHHLKTKYTDFLEDCSNKRNKFITNKNSQVYYTNIWINHFLTMKNNLGNTWINVEQEIHRVIKKFSDAVIYLGDTCNLRFTLNLTDTNFSLDDFFKHTTLDTNISKGDSHYGYSKIEDDHYIKNFYYSHEVTMFLYNQLREFTKTFELYLNETVLSNLALESPYFFSLQEHNANPSDQTIHILNFNYTDVFEKLYNSGKNTDKKYNIKSVHVHGKISSNDYCTLVLGTPNLYGSLNEKIYDKYKTEFNIFQKHNQRHKFNTIEPYQELTREVKISYTRPIFHIIGHSLDETDHSILHHILLANDDAIINIYYPDEDTSEMLCNRITDIITEKEVMSRVRFIHQHDDKRSLLKHKK